MLIKQQNDNERARKKVINSYDDTIAFKTSDLVKRNAKIVS